MRVPLQKASSPCFGQDRDTLDSKTRDEPIKPRQLSSSSSASGRGQHTDTPFGSDESDYDTDTDATSHAFTSGRQHRSNSEVSEDLDADQPASPICEKPSGGFVSNLPTLSRGGITSKHDFDAHFFRSDLLVLRNFDPFRATDTVFVTAMFYLMTSCLLPLLSQRGQLAALFINALGWRVVHTFGLGSVLKAQSERKWMVRHYLSACGMLHSVIES